MATEYRSEAIKVVADVIGNIQPRKVVVLEGPVNFTQQRFTSTSQTSTDSQSYTVTLPGTNIGLQKNLTYQISGTALVTGVPSAGTFLSVCEGIGFSEGGIWNCISSEQIQMGNINPTVYCNRAINDLNRINDDSRFQASNMSPSGFALKDFSTSFNPLNGLVSNPLAEYGSFPESDSIASPRTSYISVENINNTSFQINWTCIFPSTCAPFKENVLDDTSAIYGNTSVTCNLVFQQLFKMFSIQIAGAGSSLTNIVVSFEKSQIIVGFITPPENVIAQMRLVDDYSIFSYPTIQTFPAQTGQVAEWSPDGVQQMPVSFSLNQISGPVIPDFFVISVTCNKNAGLFAQGANACLTPNFYLPIAEQGLQLTFNNNSVCQSWGRLRMYQATVANGCSVNYETFIGQRVAVRPTGYEDSDLILGGSPIILSPSKDFNCSNQFLAPSTISNWTLTGTINAYNTAMMPLYPAWGAQPTQGFPVQLNISCVLDGVCYSNLDGKSWTRVGQISAQATEALFLQPGGMPENRIVKTIPGYQGSSLFDKLKKAFSIGKQAVEFGLKHKDAILSGVDKARKFVGRGYDNEEEESYQGGRMLQRKPNLLADRSKQALKYLQQSK